ncbi:MarR family winged helix-turn-helix transcriptional regulator [Ramlibacter alkalitolerans]|uniref:Winged helix-turn-helix transcriptional regulator n=1 Tax=Ramlibacter alkalitolerans TaxID=2039631 RepID=A0ABS1JM74_9BURK|nr:MarR family winged helix-turn-helix transcriptional regulator [Ramlibacter alkalitolerans]MBL0425231.1 winged helix-turn-helix transcriptional regulator [Ramlibacter alkalitolerans]
MIKRATRTTPPATTGALELHEVPGHCIRRLQQVAVAIFMQEAASSGVTPVQYAVLQTLMDRPGIDQRTLAGAVSFDTSTVGGVVDRLEARGLLARSFAAEDRRVRRLRLTTDGEALLAELTPAMERTQERILEPLAAEERESFMHMMQRVIGHHENLSRTEPGA